MHMAVRVVRGGQHRRACWRQSFRVADDLALWRGGFQGTCDAERGHFGLYRYFEGKLSLRSAAVAAGRALLQRAVFEDPTGQLRVDGFFDPLVEQRGDLPAQIRGMIQP
jgi:hypothetical protein